MRLLILFIVFTGLVGTADIPAHRNTTWNEIVKEVILQDRELTEIHKFLKRHETEPELYINDYQVLKSLNESIQSSERMTDRLKQLKRHLTQ